MHSIPQVDRNSVLCRTECFLKMNLFHPPQNSRSSFADASVRASKVAQFNGLHIVVTTKGFWIFAGKSGGHSLDAGAAEKRAFWSGRNLSANRPATVRRVLMRR